MIVHYHIFKNAGTTIEGILERQFPGSFATLHATRSADVLNANDLLRFLDEHPSLAAVSSHHLRYPKLVKPGLVVFDLCFIRHPLKRLESTYNYLRAAEGDDSLSRLARRYDQRTFLEKLLSDYPNLVSNPQVVQLSNAGAFTRPADRSDLDKAIQVVNKMSLPGLVERFDESLVAAEYFLRPAFPTLSLEYVPLNVSKSPAAADQSREKGLAALWGRTLYRELARLNQFDLKLFERAEAEVLRRFRLVPHRQDRLAEFHNRCTDLRKTSQTNEAKLAETVFG